MSLFSLIFLSLSAFLGATLSATSSPAVPFEGHRMVIAGPSPTATDVGEEIARQGGNVVDVAVATGFALSVTSPYFAALGGGGFALVHLAEKNAQKRSVQVLDFREVAPQAMSKTYYTEDDGRRSSRQGGTAVGVPGFPAGLWALHQKYGKLSWRKLLKRPIELAEDGFHVSGEWVRSTARKKESFSEYGRRHFFKSSGHPYQAGELFKQKGLAKALKRIARNGDTAFYQGKIAEDIVNAVKDNGGDMSLEDLKGYQVKWRQPLKTEFAGHQVYLMPPPSSGGLVLLKSLQLIEKVKLQQKKPLSVNELHLLGEIMARSFRGRYLLGDPDFHQNPTHLFTDPQKIQEDLLSIDRKKAVNLPPLKGGESQQPKESTETTHYSVLDANGNAVSLTVTLNGGYGSGVVSEKFGIALNNEMDDFTTQPGKPNMFGLIQGPGNQVQAGKRPLSSMSPTLVIKNEKAVLSLGAPGGPRIINAVLQVLYRVLVNGFDIDRAIQTPRVHHQFLPRKLFVDGKRGPFFSPEVLQGLSARGHEVQESWIGRAYGVHLTAEGVLQGAFDSRGEGGASGF